MRRLRSAWVMVAMAAAACDPGKIIMPPVPVGPVPEPTLNTAPIVKATGNVVTSTTLTAPTDAVKLGVARGIATVVTGGGAVLTQSGATFVPMALGAPDETVTLGTVEQVSARSSGGLFVAATGGLFHDGNGRLLRSPLSDSLSMTGLRGLDALGVDAAEELWLVDDTGGSQWANSKLRDVTLSFEQLPAVGKADFLVGLGPSRALFLSAGELFVVDVIAGTAKWAATGVGPVSDWARGVDGTVFMVTPRGLLRSTTSGELTLLTSDVPVKAVAAMPTGLKVSIGDDVGTLNGTSFTITGSVPSAQPHGLAVDGAGGLWALSGGRVLSFTPRVVPNVSFATQLAPVLQTKCANACHKYGGAAPSATVTFAYASENAAYMLDRLTSTDATYVMPPAGFTPRASAAEIQLFRDWIEGGLKP